MENILKEIDISPFWQSVVGVAIIIALTILAVWLLRLVLYVVASRLAARTKTNLDDQLLTLTRGNICLLVYLTGLKFLADHIGLSAGSYLGPRFFSVVNGVLFSLSVFIVTRLIVTVLSTLVQWFGQNLAKKTETKVDDEFVPLIDRAIKVILYVLCVLIILDHFKVDVTGLLTVLGVGSLAIALAAQETIANMIGGFVMMIDRPFRANDRVRLTDGTVCIVHQIGVRSTKFRTFENTLIIVPNAELMKQTVHNLTYPRPEIRVRVDVGVSYNEDLDHVRAVMLEQAEKHPRVMKTPEPEFKFLNFGDSSLDVSLRCRVKDVADQFQTQCDLREMILKRFRDENIEIPFPQRVVTTVTEPSAVKTEKDYKIKGVEHKIDLSKRGTGTEDDD